MVTKIRKNIGMMAPHHYLTQFCLIIKVVLLYESNITRTTHEHNLQYVFRNKTLKKISTISSRGQWVRKPQTRPSGHMRHPKSHGHGLSFAVSYFGRQILILPRSFPVTFPALGQANHCTYIKVWFYFIVTWSNKSSGTCLIMRPSFQLGEFPL